MTAVDVISYNAWLGAVIYLIVACEYSLILRRSGFLFLPGMTFSAVNSMIPSAPHIDFLYAAVWSGCFLMVLRDTYGATPRWFLLWTIPAATVGVALFSIVAEVRSLDGMIAYLYLATVVGTLLITELLVASNGGLIKAVGIGIGALMIYDMCLDASGIVLGFVDDGVMVARGLAHTTVGTVLGLAPLAISNPDTHGRKLGLSRPLMFTTSSMMFAVLVFGGVWFASYLIEFQNHLVSEITQPFLLFLAILVVGFSLSSSTRRSRMRVWINKNFFRAKYDYNVEWRNLSERLHPGGDDFAEIATRSILPIYHATGGTCYLRDRDQFVPRFHHGPGPMPVPILISDYPEFTRLLEQTGWIFFPARDDVGMGDHNETLPRQLADPESILMVLPLATGHDLLGMMVIYGNTKLAATLDFEDLDLMRMVGKQVSNFIAYQMLSDEIVIARQFDAFHQFTTFVVHDLKNLIAQQALVVENANRFIDKPEFVADAIKTIDNSVRKMTWMLSKLSQKSSVDLKSTTVIPVSLDNAIRDAVNRCSSRNPVPEYHCDATGMMIEADENNLVMALTHLITNAQEACKSDGTVNVTLGRQRDFAICDITDTGVGMDAEFIKRRLFKPFDSTKKNQGMGVGAYQCKQVLSQMGGHISVTSEPGKGSCFTITLPISRTETDVAAASS